MIIKVILGAMAAVLFVAFALSATLMSVYSSEQPGREGPVPRAWRAEVVSGPWLTRYVAEDARERLATGGITVEQHLHHQRLQ